MKLIKTAHGYNYWVAMNKKGEVYYNVTPENDPKPRGGYMSHTYICNIKEVPNYFIDLKIIEL